MRLVMRQQLRRNAATKFLELLRQLSRYADRPVRINAAQAASVLLIR